VPARSISLETSDYVVVADLENRTENPVFNHSLTQGLKVSLRQSGRINILAPDRVAEARELLKVPEDRPLDEPTAIAVARREGARAVISANISKLGSMYVLVCGIIDATTGETVEILREEVDRIEAVLAGLDRLCKNLRGSLGESMSQISRAGLPLAQVTTPSLDALELYSQSDRLASEGKYKEASLLLDKAIAIDSAFVMAISDLAYDYRKIGMDSLASVCHKRILPLIHRATERERLEILAVYYGPSFEIDFPKAYDQIHQLTVKYPADAFALATLGHLAMFAGDTKAALDANAKAVALYPAYDKTCYNNSAFALALDGQPDEALIWFRKAKALRPDYAAIDHYMARTYWVKEEFDSARIILQDRLTAGDLASRNKSRVILSCLDYSRGMFHSARELSLEGIRECRTYNRPGDEAYFHFILGEVAAAEGRPKEYRAQMAMAASLCISPFSELALVGTSYTRQGFTKEAEGILHRIIAAQSYDPFFVRYRASYLDLIRGYLAMAKGEIAEARRHFDAVERIQAGDPFYLLARKGAADCAALAYDSTAAGMYEFVLSRRGELVMGGLSSIRQTGVWTRWLWPETYVDLGKYYASSRRPELAGESLEEALKYWNAAEATDRHAADARALLLRTRKDQ
jgi:tetratricopeptide (TPR) repeat protein